MSYENNSENNQNNDEKSFVPMLLDCKGKLFSTPYCGLEVKVIPEGENTLDEIESYSKEIQPILSKLVIDGVLARELEIEVEGSIIQFGIIE